MALLTVKDVWPDAIAIFGTSTSATVYRYLNDAIEMLSNAGQWSLATGYMDACCVDGCIALPTDVETPLQVSLNGHPAVGRDYFFQMHMNGPGNRWDPCDWSWRDGGEQPTYSDLVVPSQLIVSIDNPEDAGKEFWVYGYDVNGAVLRTKQPDGTYVDGLQIPVFASPAMPNPDAPLVRQVTRVRKDEFVGRSRLSTWDFVGGSQHTGKLLGVYQWNDVEPRFRRIQVPNRAFMGTNGYRTGWARILYRRRQMKVAGPDDAIFLSTRFALVLACKAIKAYNDRDYSAANAAEVNAVRLLSNEQLATMPPIDSPMQIDTTTLFTGRDTVD